MTSVLSLLFLPETITDDNIYDAVELWFNDRDTAEASFGPMEEWDMQSITSTRSLFNCVPGFESDAYHLEAQSFNHDISRWDVSSVMTMFASECRVAGGEEEGQSGRSVWSSVAIGKNVQICEVSALIIIFMNQCSTSHLFSTEIWLLGMFQPWQICNLVSLTHCLGWIGIHAVCNVGPP